MGNIDDANKFVDLVLENPGLFKKTLMMENSIIKKKAEEGDVESQYDMILRDRENEMYWLKLAAENGHADAQFDLGSIIYENNEDERGVPNLEGAVKWWKLSADQGHSVAQYHMGEAYMSGHGVNQDLKKAMTMYRLSAAQGHTEARYALARMYCDGKVIGKSNIIAFALFNYNRDHDADLSSFLEKLTQDEIEAGKKLLKEVEEIGDLFKAIDRYRESRVFEFLRQITS